MIAKEYCIAFCEGYFYAQLGERLNDGNVAEHTRISPLQRKVLTH